MPLTKCDVVLRDWQTDDAMHHTMIKTRSMVMNLFYSLSDAVAFVCAGGAGYSLLNGDYYLCQTWLLISLSSIVLKLSLATEELHNRQDNKSTRVQ